MSGFAKLDSGIVNSTIWVQPHDVLRVWIWFLSQADSKGNVHTAAPALSLICMVPLERMREILLLLESADPDSRSPNDDGRRIEKMEGGGWRIINYGKYRESRDPQERKEYQRNWDNQHRPSGHARQKQSDKSPTNPDSSPTKSDRARPKTTKAEAEEEAEKIKSVRASARKCSISPDFGISPAVKAWAARKGFDRLDDHLESFKRKCEANGYRYVDWDSAFMEAIRTDWAGLRGERGGGKRSAAPASDDDIFSGVL